MPATYLWAKYMEGLSNSCPPPPTSVFVLFQAPRGWWGEPTDIVGKDHIRCMVWTVEFPAQASVWKGEERDAGEEITQAFYLLTYSFLAGGRGVPHRVKYTISFIIIGAEENPFSHVLCCVLHLFPDIAVSARYLLQGVTTCRGLLLFFCVCVCVYRPLFSLFFLPYRSPAVTPWVTLSYVAEEFYKNKQKNMQIWYLGLKNTVGKIVLIDSYPTYFF